MLIGDHWKCPKKGPRRVIELDSKPGIHSALGTQRHAELKTIGGRTESHGQGFTRRLTLNHRVLSSELLPTVGGADICPSSVSERDALYGQAVDRLKAYLAHGYHGLCLCDGDGRNGKQQQQKQSELLRGRLLLAVTVAVLAPGEERF